MLSSQRAEFNLRTAGGTSLEIDQQAMEMLAPHLGLAFTNMLRLAVVQSARALSTASPHFDPTIRPPEAECGLIAGLNGADTETLIVKLWCLGSRGSKQESIYENHFLPWVEKISHSL